MNTEYHISKFEIGTHRIALTAGRVHRVRVRVRACVRACACVSAAASALTARGRAGARDPRGARRLPRSPPGIDEHTQKR